MIAHDEGFCDGILGRESLNPYGYDQYRRFESYTAGFLYGMALRQQHNITLKVERITDDA